MNLNVILQFRRGSGSWQCPECDLENDVSLERCSMCGYKRTAAEQPIYDAHVTPVAPTFSAGGGSVGGGSGGVESGGSTPPTPVKKTVPTRLVDTGELSEARRLTESTGSAGSRSSGSSESGSSIAGVLIGAAVVIIIIVAIVAML